MGQFLSHSGITLVEMVMVILLAGILSSVAIVQFQDFRGQAKQAVTQDEMRLLKRAIAGDARAVAGGQYVFQGYEADMGALPASLQDLLINPATGTTVQTYNAITRRGWRGPYIDSSAISEARNDGWNNPYVYNAGTRTIRSRGPNGVDNAGAVDDIVINF